jgi:hypothetical protein
LTHDLSAQKKTGHKQKARGYQGDRDQGRDMESKTNGVHGKRGE